MRIGIITLRLHANYGGILQAYALQTVLERMGNEVTLIDKTFTIGKPRWKMALLYAMRSVRKFILRQDVEVFYERNVMRDEPVIRQNTDKFISRHINLMPVRSYGELSGTNRFDAYVVGSDQVLRPLFFGHIEDAYLDFAKHQKVRRVAYAGSFGVDTWEYNSRQTRNCAALVKRFDAFSVREQSGIALAREFLGRDDTVCMPDPTLLLDASDYAALFLSANTPRSKGDLLYYILDNNQEKRLVVETIAKDRNLRPFRVGTGKKGAGTSITDRIQPPIEEWLRGFNDAEFVVTDSFHACVFSIIFRKQFAVIGNKARGMARFMSLLGMFGLEDRLIENVSGISSLHDIDYSKVDQKLSRIRREALSFLESSLSGNLTGAL